MPPDLKPSSAEIGANTKSQPTELRERTPPRIWVGHTELVSDRVGLRVLIADDDAVTRTLLRATLERWGYSVQVASNGTEAWEALNSDTPPSLAILDWMMPELDGIDICRRLRARSGAYVYVMLLTSNSSKADLASGLDAGADDYITKPFDQLELQARLRVGHRMIRMEEELRLRATRDALTGLWSRSAILDALPREAARSHRSNMKLGLAIADLDHFKRVNDSLGHSAGDAVLRECAQRMQACVRPYDMLGRYGGEEFLVLLPNCDAAGARAATERLRAAVCGAPVPWNGSEIAISVSIGVTLTAEEDEDVTRAFERADRSLYEAKANGRNRVTFSV